MNRAARLVVRKPKGVAQSLGIELQQLASGRARRKRSQQRRGMPARWNAVMACQAQAGVQLRTDGEGHQEVLTRHVSDVLGSSKQRREHHAHRVHARGVMNVVEVERMRRSAVRESGRWRRIAKRANEARRRTSSLPSAQSCVELRDTRCIRCAGDDAEHIRDEQLEPVNHRRRADPRSARKRGWCKAPTSFARPPRAAASMKSSSDRDRLRLHECRSRTLQCLPMGLGYSRLGHFAMKLRPISWRWIWLVPSQIWVIFASRIRRSTR